MNKPTHGRRVRLKFLAHIEMGQSPPSSEYSSVPDDGLPFLQGTADFGEFNPSPQVYCKSPTQVAQATDILFSVRAPVGELNMADQEYGIGRGLCAIRPKTDWDRCFAWWALHEARTQLNFVSIGSTYDAVSVEDVRNLFVEAPPVELQRAIADYLERETGRIDALIAAKERLLALLAEKRRALITRAVTKGLDPHAPMKDSGIPWLGEIPAHWEVMNIKHLVALRRSRIQSNNEQYRPYIGLEDIESWTGQLVSNYRSVEEMVISTDREGDLSSNLFDTGDVLFGKLRPYLAKAWVAKFAGHCTTEALVMQPVAVEARFLCFVFLCPNFIELVDASTFGSKMPRADWDFIGNIKIPLPSASEQRAIVDYLDRTMAKLDALRAATERSIALLRERRAALISAAVTGQIDVEAAQDARYDNIQKHA